MFGSFQNNDIEALLSRPAPARPFSTPRSSPPEHIRRSSCVDRPKVAEVFGVRAREHFRLGERQVFLNHGAFGGTLRLALESKRLWAEHVEDQPVRFMDRELFGHFAHVVRRLASLVRCPPTELLPMPNVTTAMNTVLRSWQRREAKVGRLGAAGGPPRFVTFSTTYGANKKLLQQVALESGAAIDEVPLRFLAHGPDLASTLEDLQSVLCDSTALVLLDAIPSNAPVLFPVDEAVALCRRLAPKALVIVDAAHSLGQLDLDLSWSSRDAAPDIFTTNCHKWFCGPKGTALLRVQPQHLDWLEPLMVSHGHGSGLGAYYWQGMVDNSSFLALDATLDFWDPRLGPVGGLAAAQRYMRDTARQAAASLHERWGVAPAAQPELFGAMVLVPLPEFRAFRGNGALAYDQAEAVQNALFRLGFEVPVKALDGRLFVRISAHIYNYAQEYEQLGEAVMGLCDLPSL